MQHLEEQVKTRHYPEIAELAEMATPDLNQNEFRRHCVAISILQEYMTLPADTNGAIWQHLGFKAIG